MKHKTWFRLVVKAIGLVILGFSLPHVLAALITFVLYLLNVQIAGRMGFDYFLYSWPHYLSQAGQFAIGLYLFFGGKWIVNKCIPSNRPYCPECGYDLSQSRGARCPECGVTLPPELAQAAQRDINTAPPPRI